MARKPDTPCAGGCGRLLYGGSASLPDGERTCWPCRRLGRGPSRAKSRVCVICGVPFKPCDHLDRLQTTCSRQCGAVSRLAGLHTMRRPARNCGACGTTAVTWPTVYCPTCRTKRRRERNQRQNLRRRAGGTRIMSIREVAERDQWRCHLCRRRVSRRLRWPHPRSASRDHLVPVADGGTNDPANLALAHLSCNVRRGTGGTVQLQLAG